MAKKEKVEEVVTAPAVIVETKPDVVLADKPAEENADVIALKKQLSDAEDREKSERNKRIEAEKAVSEANTKVVSSQNDAVKAQKTAIENAVQVATGNISAIKKDLREAMEGGDLDKQVELNEMLADARWALNNATQTQKQFTAWEEQQKNAPKQVEQKPQYTKTEQAWIDAHPRFSSDDDYYGVVAGADAAARRKGIQPDTKAYYEYVETALVRSGLEQSPDDDGGRDNTGDEEVVVAKPKPRLAMPAAPASNSAPTSRNAPSSRSYKLSPEQQDMAHRMFGPSSSHKLSEKDAEIKYAGHQLDIRDRRANGEKI